jgi:hypothetical protein
VRSVPSGVGWRGVGVGVGVWVKVGVGVSVDVDVAVLVAVAVGVAEGVCVAVGVWVGVSVDVAVWVGVAVGVAVGVGDGVGDGTTVGVRVGVPKPAILAMPASLMFCSASGRGVPACQYAALSRKAKIGKVAVSAAVFHRVIDLRCKVASQSRDSNVVKIAQLA